MPQGSASNLAPATGCQLLRAGNSFIDVSGGMFGAMGAITVLYDRERTGKGTYIKGALFETTTFIMGQHMASAALPDGPVPPMPARVSAWSVYKLFETKEGFWILLTGGNHVCTFRIGKNRQL